MHCKNNRHSQCNAGPCMTALLQVPRTTVWRAFIHSPARSLYRNLLLHACIHLIDLLLVLDLAVGLLGDAEAFSNYSLHPTPPKHTIYYILLSHSKRFFPYNSFSPTIPPYLFPLYTITH